jgi:VWFA-related protein
MTNLNQVPCLFSPVKRLTSYVISIVFLGSLLCSQQTPGQQAVAPQQGQSASAGGPAQQPAGEMTVKDEATTSKVDEVATFRANVRLVLAPVVVRDAGGHAVGSLHKEDFEIFDNGKPQVISHFAVEHPAAHPAVAGTSAPPDASQPVTKPLPIPERYLVYVFDDLHLNFEDLNRVRAAAEHQVGNLPPSERIAIFSTSGQTMLDFTDDRARLHQTLERLQPRPMFGADTDKSGGQPDQCPDISFYMADMIVNKHDPEVTQTAVNMYLDCIGVLSPFSNVPSQKPGLVQYASTGAIVQGLAQRALAIGQQESHLAIGALKDAVRRLSVMPGQRSLIVASPGFLTPDMEYDYYDLIDRALRAQVAISTLDARGLYVVLPFGDASQPGHPDLDVQGQSSTPASRYEIDLHAASADADVLAALANSTGGTFFRNSNDLDEGFRRAAEAPEFYYVLGFTPQSLKIDGKFHSLKVNLKVHQKYDLQVRRGYYAPNHTADATEEAKQEIEDEMLSIEELHDLPVELHTQFFKPSDDSAKLTVLARVDVKGLRYKKAEGRNENDMTIVMAVFDRNGNFLQGNQKLVQMRWKDATLQGKLSSGITVKSSFDLKPGHYMVRLVARDGEQQLMSAENGAVEIP